MAEAGARRFVWADAFTDRPMGGNPCAVIFDAAGMPVEERVALTRETRLSECAFLVESQQADFGARYYTASGEIRMAGHPTIATAAALEAAGWLEGRERFTLEVGAGVLPVEIDRSGSLPRFTMTQFAPEFGATWAPERVAPLVGLEPGDILGVPQTVSTGTPFLIVRLRDHAALRRARLDLDRLEAIRGEADFFEPFLCVTQGFTAEGDTAARLMLSPPEPPEDPFTGSATGCMAAWLWRHGNLPGPRMIAEQGHWMSRPGRAEVELVGRPEAIEGVRVTGSGIVLMDGWLTL